MPQSRKDILNKVNKHDFKIKKSLGQCFLSDVSIARKIAELSCATKDTTIIEVGPGTGAMTEHLLNVSKKVIAFEVDKEVVPILKENTNNNPNLEIILGDVLTQDLSFINEIDGEVISVSNLPYYITTPIISLFLNNVEKIRRMYFMVQKEVGDRLSAKVGTKDYNAFSILVQYYADVKSVLNVKRTCFTPSPNVDSAVIEIKRKDRLNKANDEKLFKKIVETSFKERRKTLLNNLSSLFGKENTIILLEELDINPQLRAENLSIDDFIKISNYVGDKYEYNR